VSEKKDKVTVQACVLTPAEAVKVCKVLLDCLESEVGGGGGGQ